MVDEYPLVCAVDGVLVVQGRDGRLFHSDSLPRDVNPEHEIQAMSRSSYYAAMDLRYSLRSAASDMLTHHDQLHPASGCEFAERLAEALRS